MTWQVLIPLITQNGIPWAYQFWLIVTQHSEPTQEAWDKLLMLSQKPILDYVNEARAKVGLSALPVYDPMATSEVPSKP